MHTEDGYILNMFRLLPPGVERAVDCSNCFKGEPVFFMHGIGSNAARWLNRDNSRINSMPIALAKKGYDVWLGNARGTHMSNEHEKLDWIKDQREYWNYSFPEMALNDISAMIDTVFEETGGKRINYIGFSLGTTVIFYSLSDQKTLSQMRKQLGHVVALCPIMIPKLEELSLTYSTYYAFNDLAVKNNIENYMFGPGFDERVSGLCELISFIAGPEACKTILE